MINEENKGGGDKGQTNTYCYCSSGSKGVLRDKGG